MSTIQHLIAPRRRDLGGFTVDRVLPVAKKRTVGPFIFFDEIGPADFAPGTGIDVRPHPHIGLATVTFLYEGELRHRDSLGFDQVIRPGDVNWMTAGRGIVHSERTDAGPRTEGQRLHGVQSWVALPEADAETAPAFRHYPRSTLPIVEAPGARIQLIAGAAHGAASPVEVHSPLFYCAIDAEGGAVIPLPDDHEERAVYSFDSALDIDGEIVPARTMAVIAPGSQPLIRATATTRAMTLGGAPIGDRFIFWNFVATSRERIELAKRDWADAAGRGFINAAFSLPPGETEHIPLPEDG